MGLSGLTLQKCITQKHQLFWIKNGPFKVWELNLKICGKIWRKNMSF
jgi:hypothetical protein